VPVWTGSVGTSHDPTSGQAWRRKGRALGAWSRSARHILGSPSEQSVFCSSFPRLDYIAKAWVVREVAVRSGEPFAGEGRRLVSGLQEARAPLWKRENEDRSKSDQDKEESKEAKRRRKGRGEKRGAARLEKRGGGRERRWMASLRLSPTAETLLSQLQRAQNRQVGSDERLFGLAGAGHL
jgi:hypothetical protein